MQSILSLYTLRVLFSSYLSDHSLQTVLYRVERLEKEDGRDGRCREIRSPSHAGLP